MQNVSLLPPEIKQRRREERKQGKLIRVALILFAALLAVYAFLLVSSLLTRGELQALQEERETVESQAAALAEYEDLYHRMSETEELVNAAMGRVPEWGKFLGDLGRAVDPDIALLNVSTDYDEEKRSFEMRGWTYTHRNVAAMLDRVQPLEQLEDVRCRVSAATTVDGQAAVEFTVDAGLLPGPHFFDPEEEDG